MNADFLTVLEFWEREKGISRDILVAAVEEALLSAAKKAVGPARELRCVIDQKSGDIKAFAKLVVSDKVLSKHDQIGVFDARRIKADAKLGDEIEVEVVPEPGTWALVLGGLITLFFIQARRRRRDP